MADSGVRCHGELGESFWLTHGWCAGPDPWLVSGWAKEKISRECRGGSDPHIRLGFRDAVNRLLTVRADAGALQVQEPQKKRRGVRTGQRALRQSHLPGISAWDH